QGVPVRLGASQECRGYTQVIQVSTGVAGEIIGDVVGGIGHGPRVVRLGLGGGDNGGIADPQDSAPRNAAACRRERRVQVLGRRPGAVGRAVVRLIFQ